MNKKLSVFLPLFLTLCVVRVHAAPIPTPPPGLFSFLLSSDLLPEDSENHGASSPSITSQRGARSPSAFSDEWDLPQAASSSQTTTQVPAQTSDVDIRPVLEQRRRAINGSTPSSPLPPTTDTSSEAPSETNPSLLIGSNLTGHPNPPSSLPVQNETASEFAPPGGTDSIPPREANTQAANQPTSATGSQASNEPTSESPQLSIRERVALLEPLYAPRPSSGSSRLSTREQAAPFAPIMPSPPTTDTSSEAPSETNPSLLMGSNLTGHPNPPSSLPVQNETASEFATPGGTDSIPPREANTQTADKPTSAAGSQASDGPTSEANIQPTTETTSEANTQAANEPIGEASSQAVDKPTSEASSHPATEPTSEANTQAADEQLTPPEAGPAQQNRLHRNALSGNRHIVQPAAASYIANLAAANSLFTMTLHDRTGETRYTDVLTGQQQITSLWLRQVGSHNNWRDSTGQVKTQSNSYVAQLGGDVAQWSTNGRNRGHLGLMAGYGNNRSNSHSSVTGSSAKGTIRGYSVGLYGTWFANDIDKSGLYIDSWLQYNWFNNYVNAEKVSTKNYQSKGVNLSLEAGYTLTTEKTAEKQVTGNAWYFQPQAQAVLMGVKADSHLQTNGDRAISSGTGNIQTRLGIRAFKKEPHTIAKGKGYEFSPFIEANWLHNTRDFSSTVGGTRATQTGARNIGEVKVGVTGKINQKVNLWGNISAQIGDKGYNSTSAMIGIKYSF